jgi:hypothetical protein
MTGFDLLDYLVCANGIIGALHNIGAFGKPVAALRVIFMFSSMGIVGYCGVILLLNLIGDYLPPQQRRKYVLYTVTNSLPIIVMLIQHYG